MNKEQTGQGNLGINPVCFVQGIKYQTPNPLSKLCRPDMVGKINRTHGLWVLRLMPCREKIGPHIPSPLTGEGWGEGDERGQE